MELRWPTPKPAKVSRGPTRYAEDEDSPWRGRDGDLDLRQIKGSGAFQDRRAWRHAVDREGAQSTEARWTCPFKLRV